MDGLRCGGRETLSWWLGLANPLRNEVLGIGPGDCVLGAEPAAASGLQKRPALDEGQVQGRPKSSLSTMRLLGLPSC